MKQGEHRPYHHGDLRQALLDAALQFVAEHERPDFTLREVARQAGCESAGYSSHVGYFLIDDGRELLRKLIGYRSTILRWIRERIICHAPSAYLLAIEFGAFVLTASLLLACGRSVSMAVILPLLLVPATGAAIDIVNQLIAFLFPPRVLPKLDLSKGIPDECLTVVAVPTLLLNESQTRQMVEALEVRFLGNRDKNLHFALLTDSVDSRNGPADEDPLIRLCSQLIERLNRKYAQQSRGSFFHFHHDQRCTESGEFPPRFRHRYGCHHSAHRPHHHRKSRAARAFITGLE